MRGRRAVSSLVAALGVVLALAGCVHYPSVEDIGGVRVQPQNGRAVREGESAAFYVDLHSTGKFGDVLTGVAAPIARDARLVDSAGTPVPTLEIPGTTTVSFAPGGPHAVLADFTRPLVPGETIIVTLMFQKLGPLGILTVVE
jgi:copper(I)-binding protein